MVTEFSQPAVEKPTTGWSFDEDISWGYGEPPPGAPAPAAPQPSTNAAPPTNTSAASPKAHTEAEQTTASTIDTPAPAGALNPPGALDPAHPPTPVNVTGAAKGIPAEETSTVDAAAVGPPSTHPARMVLGLASLAAERLRGKPSAGALLTTGVGLVQQTAAGARGLAGRVFRPASRMALDTMDVATNLPVTGKPLRSLAKSRDRFARLLAEARNRGQATVAAGRADAEAFVRSNVAETMSWAQAQAVPQIVDGLVPHLVDQVVPRILEGTLPEIRATVLPAVIDDLTNSPQVRDLVLEQGRGVVGDAAQHLRSTTAAADDRVESVFRRFVRSPAPDDEDLTDMTGPPPGAPDRSANGG